MSTNLESMSNPIKFPNISSDVIEIQKRIKIHHVLKNSVKKIKQEEDMIDMMRDYCSSKSITFLSREYNSVKYVEDQDEISELPAFHIYVNNEHYETLFIFDNYEDIIGKAIKYTLKKLRNKNSFWDKIAIYFSFMKKN